MTITLYEARQQGGRYAVRAALVTQLTVLLLLGSFLLSATRSADLLMELFTWIGLPTFSVFSVGTLLFAYLVGQKVGAAVLMQKRNHWRTSYAAGMLIVVLSTLLASLYTLIAQVLAVGIPQDWWMYFVAKPLVWIISLSLIPVGVASTWYGYQLSKQRNEK